MSIRHHWSQACQPLRAGRAANLQKRRQCGGTLVLVTVFMVALFGFAALSIDVGNVLVQRKKISEAADAAALAAVTDWATNSPAASVQTVGQQYGVTNGLLSSELTGVNLGVDTGVWDTSGTPGQFIQQGTLSVGTNQAPAVRVRAHRVVPMYFGKVVGWPAMDPHVESIAIAAAGQCVPNLLPVAVCVGPDVIHECDTITLHFTNLNNGTNSCGPSASSPNFGALDFNCGGGGTKEWNGYMITGYPNQICSGQCVCVKTGNLGKNPYKDLQDRLAGLPPFNCTPGAAAPDNARTAIVPRVDTLDVTGNQCVHVTGFYVVALDDPHKDSGGQITVTATFVKALEGIGIIPSTGCGPGMVCAIGLVK